MEKSASAWRKVKEEGLCFYNNQQYQSAAEKYIDAWKELTSINEYAKDESSKLLSNISLMYLKLLQEHDNEDANNNDEEVIFQKSKQFAQQAIDELPSWYKGYLRLAECYKYENNIDNVLETLSVYLGIADEHNIPEEFQSYMNSVRYYTHRKVMMKRSVWKDVTYPDHFVVIDQKGAGHYNSLQMFMEDTGLSFKNTSIIVRPGVYLGNFFFKNSTFEIIGDWTSTVKYDNEAIKDEPSVIFANSHSPRASTLFMMDQFLPPNTVLLDKCEAVFKNLRIEENLLHHPIHAITAHESKVDIYSCSFFSKCSAAIAFSQSEVLLKYCSSVGAYSAVLSSKESFCELKNCYISKTVGLGIEIKNDSTCRLYQCIIEDCEKQGLCVYSGAKSVKIKNCTFSNNATQKSMFESPGSLQLRNCRASVKDTTICNQNKSVGIVIEGGYGIFENLQIDHCLTGMLVQSSVQINRSIFTNCGLAVTLCKNIKGPVQFEDNTMINCSREISQADKSTNVIFIGKEKNSCKEIDVDRNSDFMKSKTWKDRNKERNKLQKNNFGPVGEVFDLNEKTDLKSRNCEFCGISAYLSGKPLEFCGKCKVSLYCSSDCQQRAWKTHKPMCADYVKAKGKNINSKNVGHAAAACNKTDGEAQQQSQGTQTKDDPVKEGTSKVKEWQRKNKKKKKKKPAF